MSAPNMATITASLERSLQNCSLNHHQTHTNGGTGAGFRTRTRTTRTSSNGNSDSPEYSNDPDATLDLNSHVSLPYHWEQCLDLKSGEIYYINWRTGMKAKEDPRRTSLEDHYYYTDEDEDEDEDEDDDENENEDDDDDSSSSSSSSSEVYSPEEAEEEGKSCSASCSGNEERNYNNNNYEERSRQVLVVAGCKVCLMYFMVPKQVQLCPKCTTAQLLHFN